MSMRKHRPKKLMRTSRACDFCHKRSIRCCSSANRPDSCENCVDFDIPCKYDRPIKRGRGRAAATQKSDTVPLSSQPSINTEPVQTVQTDLNTTRTRSYIRSRSQTTAHEQQRLSTSAPDPPWKAFASVSRPLITSLLNAYFQVVYPIFPFFNRHLFFERLARDVHLSDRDFFATTMATCALAAGRMRDGSISHGNERDLVLNEVPPKIFREASESCLPADITNVNALDALRAYPLLALSAIQERQIDVMHKYIGLYFAILSIRRWHDESNWPASWTLTEREEMRRLYWSTYTLDVYSSIVWNGCVHFQEAHSRVQYPSNDTDFEIQFEDPSLPSWMVGWNFTTDLYRVLEHAVSRFRTQTSQFNLLEVVAPSSPTFSSGLNARANSLYSALPEAFKTIKEMTGVPAKDIYGFQAANIQATLALLRMVLFSVEANSDVDKKCSVASDLLSVFHRIPKSYLRAISAPLIYHLSGIGQILGSVITSPISEASYSKVRELLVSMAALLESLESVLQRRAGAARSLLDQVDRIDQFMAAQMQSQIDLQALSQAHATIEAWTNLPTAEDISFRYQLPNDIIGDWSWPLDFDDTPFAFFEWYGNA